MWYRVVMITALIGRILTVGLLTKFNYLEAAGIILAIRKGINLNSLKRPLKKIQEYSYPINNVE